MTRTGADDTHPDGDGPGEDSDRCPCARRLDDDFDCRATGDCPRLRWLERFDDDSSAADRRVRSEITRIATALGLPDDVAATARRLFEHARERGFLSGRTVEGVAAGAVYAAARQTGLPRTLEEVAAVGQVSSDRVGRLHRQFGEQLDLPIAPGSAVDHLPRYADRLDLSPRTRAVARRILEAAAERPLADGRHPVSLVAAAVYAAGLLTGERVAQARVGEATGVAPSTISELYHELLEGLDVLPAER